MLISDREQMQLIRSALIRDCTRTISQLERINRGDVISGVDSPETAKQLNRRLRVALDIDVLLSKELD